jgi:hypothetical protein
MQRPLPVVCCVPPTQPVKMRSIRSVSQIETALAHEHETTNGEQKRARLDCLTKRLHLVGGVEMSPEASL